MGLSVTNSKSKGRVAYCLFALSSFATPEKELLYFQKITYFNNRFSKNAILLKNKPNNPN